MSPTILTNPTEAQRHAGRPTQRPCPHKYRFSPANYVLLRTVFVRSNTTGVRYVDCHTL